MNTSSMTWLKTRALSKKYDDGKFREGTQRKLVVATLLRCETPQTLDSLVEKLRFPLVLGHGETQGSEW